jgi:hypothetical protein
VFFSGLGRFSPVAVCFNYESTSPCINLPLYDKIIQKMGDYMSRTARLLSKSGVYHIMLRGNEKKAVFCDDEDRIKYLATMLKMKEEGN